MYFVDTEYIRAFLTTHRFFINTGVLLLKLIQRYYIEPPPNCTPEELKKFKVGKSVIQIRTINVIKKWIELQVSDFDEDEGQLLECFLKVNIHIANMTHKIRNLLQREELRLFGVEIYQKHLKFNKQPI